MRYWWVNQNQTYNAEVDGGYIWSPKCNRNGARNQFYENMREVAPGDSVFSFCNRQILALGIATSNCYEAPKPDAFGTAGKNWQEHGWQVDIAYTQMTHPIVPKEHIESIRPHLPEKYSPLRRNGDGLQSVYLAEINQGFADLLRDLLNRKNNLPIIDSAVPLSNGVVTVRTAVDDRVEAKILETTLSETEKEQLVKARRGQGQFRVNVQGYETCCRVTGIRDLRFLRASHIKPWRVATNPERLDGENGLLLAPNIDLLFDGGFISFEDDGILLVSPVVDAETLAALGVPRDSTNVGKFTPSQKGFLAYHRKELFLKATRQR